VLICEAHANLDRASEWEWRCEKRVLAFEKKFDEAVKAGDVYLQGRWQKLLRRAETHWKKAEVNEERAWRTANLKSLEGLKRPPSPEARRIAKKTRWKTPPKPPPQAPRSGKAREQHAEGSETVDGLSEPVRGTEEARRTGPDTERRREKRSAAIGNRYLTVRQVAEKLGVGARFVYELVKTGELKSRRLGPQRIRIPENEVDRWAGARAEREEAGGSAPKPEAEQEPEAQATLLRLVETLEGIADTLRVQQQQFADTARTLAQTGEDLARVAKALADQAPNAERGQRAEPKESRRGKAEDKKKPAKDTPWLKVSETAARLGVSTGQIYRWISEGELAATKFGQKTTRVRVSEVERAEREGIDF